MAFGLSDNPCHSQLRATLITMGSRARRYLALEVQTLDGHRLRPALWATGSSRDLSRVERISQSASRGCGGRYRAGGGAIAAPLLQSGADSAGTRTAVAEHSGGCVCPGGPFCRRPSSQVRHGPVDGARSDWKLLHQ